MTCERIPEMFNGWKTVEEVNVSGNKLIQRELI